MGSLNVIPVIDSTDLRAYSKLLFADVEALERMIDQGMIEEDITRIGAEQELCLIDQSFRPAPLAEEILQDLNDDHFTTELAKFNLEINLDPLMMQGDCLTQLFQSLQEAIEKCRKSAEKWNSAPLLTGILPTIKSSDLSMDFMSPRQRYWALNQAIQHIRNGPQEFHIQGTDELFTRHDNVMFESCNTSFQVHYQIGARDFVKGYNWAQAISGPILAAVTNSPLFLGKRLWRESRIALFQQATDTRGYQEELRNTKARVVFGESWLQNSLTDLIKQDISTYRPLVIRKGLDQSMDQLQNGEIPKLKAFSLFNGTIYRWNRPCYGITEGKPHLRIENRYLPSGPSMMDEVANAAVWLGLMHQTSEMPDFDQSWEFSEAKSNFIRAARHGLNTKMNWFDGKSYEARDLILEELLPISEEGLNRAELDEADIKRYINIFKERVQGGATGSTWILNSFNQLKKDLPDDAAALGLTEVMLQRQKQGVPVHEWGQLQEEEVSDGPHRYQRIDQIMSKNLYTVDEEDVIDLVPNIMKWNQIRHMLVENRMGELVGLVTMGRLGQYYAEHSQESPAVMVKEVMIREVITVSPETETMEALRIMKDHKIGCLPVLNHHQKLVGIVTDKDFMPIVESYLSKGTIDQTQPTD